MRFTETILIVLVLYKHKASASQSISALACFLKERELQMDLFVYDNSPEVQINDDLPDCYRLHYRHDHTNGGVSKAYNAGAAKARSLGKQWILLLDQDTIFPKDFLLKYEAAVFQNIDLQLFVPKMITNKGDIISPCRYVHKHGQWLKKAAPGIWDLRIYSPINSGMLIDLDLFTKAGGYLDAVKLDFADFQFIERANAVVDKFYVLDMECLQDFSGEEKNVDKLKHRYALFCESALACPRTKWSDNWWYFWVVSKRMLKLTVTTRSAGFGTIFLKKYIFS